MMQASKKVLAVSVGGLLVLTFCAGQAAATMLTFDITNGVDGTSMETTYVGYGDYVTSASMPGDVPGTTYNYDVSDGTTGSINLDFNAAGGNIARYDTDAGNGSPSVLFPGSGQHEIPVWMGLMAGGETCIVRKFDLIGSGQVTVQVIGTDWSTDTTLYSDTVTLTAGVPLTIYANSSYVRPMTGGAAIRVFLTSAGDLNVDNFQFIPEPVTASLLVAGVVGLVLRRHRRR